MPGMDNKTLQASINMLNAEIQRLTSARDTLVILLQGGKTPRMDTAAKQRAAWAAQKRKQRAAKKKAKK